jgi:hypothetical protein
MPFEGMANFLNNNPQAIEKVIESIKESLKEETTYHNTHPSLKDRIQALNSKPVLPAPPKVNAAQAWFGEHYNQVLKDFDELWYEHNQQK